MEANPKVEVAAWDGEHFLRYYGTADLTKNEAVVEKAFELMPEIAEAYKSNGWEMGVFFIKTLRSVFSSFLIHMMKLRIDPNREFPGGPVVRISCFHCQGPGLDPWSVNQDPAN